MSKFSIAIDGPSASGKSTMAKILATRLGFTYIDTGAMYRAYTLAVLERGLNPKSEAECDTLIGKIVIDFDGNNHITLDGKDVNERVRDNDVADNVSYVSTYKNIRLWLVEIQRKLANDRSVIMDGRDIGTYVLPNASVKFFQIADVNERAERRYMENLGKGIQTTREECLENLKKRDYIDSHREFAPLKQASDSILIDTTNMKISDVIDKMLNILKDKGIC